ncbi:MAG TPA: DUF2059 domain-containing protein [Thermoanaerobaculia bacterium]|nr:DUF2059 domain-containing protein [Thermoanaerobaculia bacterium]
MRSRLVALVCALTLGLAACKPGAPAAPAAPTPTLTPNAAASAAAAQELFKSLKLQTSLSDTANAMIDSEISRNPGLTPYREVMVTWLKKYMTWEKMEPELVRMYTDTFTEAELKQMAVFYASPAGQKSLEKLPEMMQRTAMAGARLSQEHQDELRTAMAAKSEELKAAAAAGGKAPGGKAPAPGGKPPARPAPAPNQPPQ